jgi:FkbM family methyltransferase
MNARVRKIGQHLNRAPEIVRCALHTPAWLALTARYTGLNPTGFPFVARFRNGSTFEFNDLADLATWWQIFYRKVYPVEPTDRLIIDAGANIGAFTLYALTQASQAEVIAVEPFPATFARLRAAIERSPLRARVELVNAALGARRHAVAMQSGSMASQFRRVLPDASPEAGTAVECCTLPEIIARATREIDLLKMDIEGSEYDSLLTSPPETLRRIRRIVMEFHPVDRPGPPQPEGLLRYLKEAGFDATEVQDHGAGYGMAYLRRN